MSYDTGASGCGRLAPCLARESASSYPFSPVSSGIHCSTTFLGVFVQKLVKVLSHF